MLSPPASSVVSDVSSANNPTLPHPREAPLRPGGSKESAFIRYVDEQLLHVQRRFAKRTSPTTANLGDAKHAKVVWDVVLGYSSMQEVCRDIGELINVVWVSGSPTLQVPYLISIGLLVSTVVQGMPPTPKSLFRLLNKLDHAFASLLQGRDVETGERLPGFAGGRGVSGTEKVRIRSLVERTRLNVIEAFKRGEFEQDATFEEATADEDKMDSGTDGELVLEGAENETADELDDSWDMQLARVYDRTIVELGDSLENPSIGIVTEHRG